MAVRYAITGCALIFYIGQHFAEIVPRGNKPNVADWGNLAVSGYNTRQLSKLKGEMSEMSRRASRENRENMEIQQKKLGIMKDALKVQFAATLTLASIEEDIVELVSTAGSISNLLMHQENRENNLASLRVIMHKLNRSLDEIENYFVDEYPEWGLKSVKDVKEVIERNDISVESFSRSWEDIAKVEELIDRVARIHDSLVKKLTEADS